MHVTRGAPGLGFRDDAEAEAWTRQLGQAIQLGWRVRRAAPPSLLDASYQGLKASFMSANVRVNEQVRPGSGLIEADIALAGPCSEEPDMLGTELAARLAGVDPRTMRRWIKDGLVEASRGPRREHRVNLASLTARIQREPEGK